MTKDEALELIERIPYITTIATTGDKFRVEYYRKALAKDDPVDWIKVIKTCHIRRNVSLGKVVSTQESQYGETAKKRLNSALAAALGIPENEVEKFIEKHLEEEI